MIGAKKEQRFVYCERHRNRGCFSDCFQLLGFREKKKDKRNHKGCAGPSHCADEVPESDGQHVGRLLTCIMKPQVRLHICVNNIAMAGSTIEGP